MEFHLESFRSQSPQQLALWLLSVIARMYFIHDNDDDDKNNVLVIPSFQKAVSSCSKRPPSCPHVLEYLIPLIQS